MPPNNQGMQMPYQYSSPAADNDGGFKFSAPFGFTGQGAIWFLNTAPAGWLLCDGSLVDKVKYPDLFMLLGDTFGTQTTTQFYLPDLRGRAAVGRDSTQTEFDVMGEGGGTKTHTLTTAEMPSHNHNFVRTSNGLPIDIAGGGSAGNGVTVSASVFLSSTGITNTGGGGAHNNLSPYRVVNYIIKT